ncbi:hypothetical protein KKB55_06055 [Myxococcota bacterium]|nr:hypothetical protein [Myxococcota bacterium]MBU1897315.1 hypothetical protein [Myxococcota bacterium]
MNTITTKGAGLLALALLLSCGGETAGENVTYRATLGGAASTGSPSAFETPEGWSVSLSEARMALGPIYLYGGEARGALAWLKPALLGVAVACPTHAQFDNGPVLGEILTQRAVDLLAGPMDGGEIFGVKGTVASAEIHLHPPGEISAGGGDFGALGGESMRFVGEATKGGEARRFVATLTIPDEGLMRIVESIPADGPLSEGSTLAVEVLVDQLFASVRFETLSERDDEGRYLFKPGVQATAALLMAARARATYRVSAL